MNSLKEQVIEEVRKYSFLYDLQDPRYSNNLKKDEAWRQISRALNCPETECKKTWNNLRESHRRAMKRKKTKSGMAATTTKKWVFEDEMSFLLPHYMERPTITSVDTCSISSVDLEDDVDDNSNLSLNAHDTQRTETDNSIPSPSSPSLPRLDSSPQPQNSCNQTPAKKKKKAEDNNSSASAELMKFLLKEKNNKNEDDTDNFFLSIAATVKKLDEYEQAIVKKKIYLLVAEMDLKRIADANKSRQAQDECLRDSNKENLIILDLPVDTESES